MSINVYDAFRPLHILSKLTGFALFTVDRQTFEVFFSKSDVVFVIFNIIVIVTLNYIYYQTYFTVTLHKSEVVKIFFPTLAYANCFVLTCSKVWHFFHRHSFARLIKTMNEIDVNLAKLGFRFDYNQQRSFVIGMMLFVNLFQLLAAIASFFAQRHHKLGISWSIFIFISWGFLVNLVRVNQFITSILGLRERFKAVNEIIR